MSESKKKTVLSSFFFKFLESCGTQDIAFVVSVLLARRISPADYDVLGLLMVFVTIFQVFVQSGLNTALIQRKDVDETDLSSVFYASMGIALAAYLLLFFSAPAIAGYFGKPSLRPTLRVVALVLLPGAYHSVQLAVITRRMQFKKLMWASLGANVISGTVGIAMAYGEMGVWALVGQQLVNQLALCVILSFLLDWRPRRLFSWQKLKSLYSFGWKILLSSLIDTIYNNLRSVVIGKKYDEGSLAYYNRGKQFPELLINSVNGSIQSVMLPALSGEQDRLTQMRAMLRRSVTVSSYLVFPLLTGLALVARPMVALLLTDKWLPCVPFLQICCVDFAFYPIHTANLQAINAQGRSDIFLKLEVIKKIYGFAILLVTVFCFDSALAIVTGGAVSTLISAIVNAWPNKKLLGYGYIDQMRDLLPTLGLTLAMGVAVYALGLLPLSDLSLLLVQVAGGVAVYGALSALLKVENYTYIKGLLRGLRSRTL